MGSTVSTDKKVAAFKTPQGRVAYILFEETYEKNTYPHTPKWSCTGIGYLDEVLKQIFWFAASTEGGMLKGKYGDTTPEAYVTAWLKCLAAPRQTHDREIQLRFGTYSAPLYDEPAVRARVLSSLREDGYDVIATTLDAGPVAVSLYKDFDVLRSIYTKNRVYVGPWRILRPDFHDGDVDASLAYEPETVKLPYTPPPVYRVGQFNYLVGQEDGSLRGSGWAYSIVGSFVAGYGAKQLTHPGSYRANFKAFRDALHEAPHVDPSVVIDFASHKPSEDRKYRTEALMEIAAKLGNHHLNFSMTLGEINAIAAKLDDRHMLSRLADCDDLVWTLPKGNAVVHQQEALFA